MNAHREEDMAYFLPRSLSYVQDGYVDEYSVSSAFVQNPRESRQPRKERSQFIRLFEAMVEEGEAIYKQEIEENESSASRKEKQLVRETHTPRTATESGHELDDYNIRIEAFLKFMSSKGPVYKDTERKFSSSKLRKSSSLKTNKTPPGTPGSKKKVVRFADAMGLDLNFVRSIGNVDIPPKVPASALADLRVGLEEDRRETGSSFLTACFSQPGAGDDFRQKVLAQKVYLENAVMEGVTITGVIRVANIAFDKTVQVRYSTDRWTTFHDIAASYVLNSCDGPTDRFSFSIVAPAVFDVGFRLEFAIAYSTSCTVFWDNNGGMNYAFECFAKTVPTEAENTWMSFL
ncbi:glycogen-binding subunit 76A-like [Haliotis rubra]|uniref:glycogen-binding subunit 76A-like n=1 Tax=Haliotis rubra TaxID=36100 RepID=UPI001EE5855D|nr:glycogen-binding subunit 76A-like [Haliotis rubra]